MSDLEFLEATATAIRDLKERLEGLPFKWSGCPQFEIVKYPGRNGKLLFNVTFEIPIEGPPPERDSVSHEVPPKGVASEENESGVRIPWRPQKVKH